jgi:hypothetical protein
MRSRYDAIVNVSGSHVIGFFDKGESELGKHVELGGVCLCVWVGMPALHGCWVPLPAAAEPLGSLPARHQFRFRQSEIQPQRLLQDQGEVSQSHLQLG